MPAISANLNMIDVTSRHIVFCLEVSAAMRRKSNEVLYIDEGKQAIQYYVSNIKSRVDVITFGQRIVGYMNQSLNDLDDLFPQIKPNEMMCHIGKAISLAFGQHLEGELKKTSVFVICCGIPSEKVFFEDTLMDVARKVQSKTDFKVYLLMPRGTDVKVQNYYSEMTEKLWDEGAHITSGLLEDFDFDKAL